MTKWNDKNHLAKGDEMRRILVHAERREQMTKSDTYLRIEQDRSDDSWLVTRYSRRNLGFSVLFRGNTHQEAKAYLAANWDAP